TRGGSSSFFSQHTRRGSVTLLGLEHQPHQRPETLEIVVQRAFGQAELAGPLPYRWRWLTSVRIFQGVLQDREQAMRHLGSEARTFDGLTRLAAEVLELFLRGKITLARLACPRFFPFARWLCPKSSLFRGPVPRLVGCPRPCFQHGPEFAYDEGAYP